MKRLESAINIRIGSIDTGEWRNWNLIFMIVNEDHIRDLNFHETSRLTRKDMTLDFRVFVDHKRGVTAAFDTCIDLLISALDRTVPYFSKATISKEAQEAIIRAVHIASDDVEASTSIKH